jgi:uncharacterized RDD family membrane protein YckC
MNWYYLSLNNDRIGPVTEQQLISGIQNHQITPETEAWHEGLPNWSPLSQIKPEFFTSTPSSSPNEQSSPSQPQLTSSNAPQSIQTKIAPKIEQLTDLAKLSPQEKEAYLQKIRQGISTDLSKLTYASIGTRWLAKILDALIIALMYVSSLGVMSFLGINEIYNVFSIYIITFCYNLFLNYKYQATWGKMAVGIVVVTPDQKPITLTRSTVRAASEIVNNFTMGIGLIIALFDSQRRTLHDHISGTRVIEKIK